MKPHDRGYVLDMKTYLALVSCTHSSALNDVFAHFLFLARLVQTQYITWYIQSDLVNRDRVNRDQTLDRPQQSSDKHCSFVQKMLLPPFQAICAKTLLPGLS